MGSEGATPGLTRGRITAAAVQLLDEVGLDQLSTRRLAAKLGVSSPTLYWHIAGKDELLDLVAESLCAEAFDIDPSEPWHDQLASGMRQFRALLSSHRDAAALLTSRPPRGPHRLGHLETTMRILSDAGFSDRDTAGIAQLLSAHVLASVPSGAGPLATRIGVGALDADAGPPEGLPTLARVLPAALDLSDDERFELGVEVILDGLSSRLARVGTAERRPSRQSAPTVDRSHIRVKAMLVAPNADRTAHAVTVLPPTAENPAGYQRFIGGSVELGEEHRDAVRREVREELDADIHDLVLLGTVENLFAIDGEPGHEVVFVYSGRLDPEPPAAGGMVRESDGSLVPVVWRPVADQDETVPVYPAGALELFRCRDGSGGAGADER